MQKIRSHQLIEQKSPLPVETRSLNYGLAFVFLITIAGLFLALQEWKSRKPAFDMLVYIYNADAFLKNGTLPQYGDISSYGSFSTPGTSWLMMPGLLTFDDPRLYEKTGSAVLYFGTLMGIFLLALTAFGPKSAYLSVLLYGLSSIGLSFAGSLWPIGHPFFYVWMAYFACLWVARQDARYLAASVSIWATGMYMDMSITPALTMIPVLWLVYRPRVFSWHLIAGGLFVLALWYPYLHFETGRNFVDIKSQLFRRNIAPENFKEAWCNANLTLQKWDEPSDPMTTEAGAIQPRMSSVTTLLINLFGRARTIMNGLLSNFVEISPVFIFSVIMLLLLLTSIVVFGISGLSSRSVEFISGIKFFPRWIGANIRRLRSSSAAWVRNPAKATVLVFCLLVPWSALLVVAEPGRPERFLWLWPLQVILIAAAVTNLLPRLRSPYNIGRLSQVAFIALIIIVISPTAILSSIEAWLQLGWAGSDSEDVQVVEYVARHLNEQGKDQAVIGYRLFIYPFMARYHIIDPHYKVGAEFDLLFQYMYGISNIGQCAEGISPSDEYRIVQINPEQSEAAPRHYFNISMENNFRLLQQFENFQVFIRD